MRPAIKPTLESGFAETKVGTYSATSGSDFLSGQELTMHIEGCVSNDRLSQKKIYTSFYGYAITICNRYASNYDDSVEILNDSFLKVFKEIHRYAPAYSDVESSFKGWLRKIVIYTAIDHFRRNQKFRLVKELDNDGIWISAGGEDALDKISYDEILRSIQKLTPGYRIILNLFIIEGLTHKEIAARLGISTGTTKSNLARARLQLQKILFQQNQIIPGESSTDSSKIVMPENSQKNNRLNISRFKANVSRLIASPR